MAEGTAALFINFRTGQPTTVVTGIGTASITNDQLAGPVVTTSFSIGTASVTNAQLAGPIVAIIGTSSVSNSQLAGPIVAIIGTASITNSQLATPPGSVLLTSGTVSNQAQLDLSLQSYFGSGYTAYELVLSGVVPQTDGSSLFLRTSPDNGSNFDSGSSDYGYSGVQITEGPVSTNLGNSGDDLILVVAGLGGSSGENASLRITLYDPENTTIQKFMTMEIARHLTSGLGVRTMLQGRRISNSAYNAIRLAMDSGNINVAKYSLYGLAG